MEGGQGSLTHLEETLTRLLERLKTWDPDGDGLSTYAEFLLYGTSWSDPDTDGDGYLDGTECWSMKPILSIPVPSRSGSSRERRGPGSAPALEESSPVPPVRPYMEKE